MGGDHQSVTDEAGVRPRLAVARYGQHDQVGFDGAQRLVSDAEPIDHSGRKVLHRDVAMARQFARDRGRLRLGKIELKTALGLVPLVEAAGAVDARLTLRVRRNDTVDARALAGFDANHLGAQMRQLQSTKRSRPHPAKIQDAHPAERSRRLTRDIIRRGRGDSSLGGNLRHHLPLMFTQTGSRASHRPSHRRGLERRARRQHGGLARAQASERRTRGF